MGRAALPALDQAVLYQKHDGYEGEGINKDVSNLELLKIQMNPKADAARTAEELDHEYDLPDDRDSVSRRDCQPGRKLRQDQMPEPFTAR